MLSGWEHPDTIMSLAGSINWLRSVTLSKTDGGDCGAGKQDWKSTVNKARKRSTKYIWFTLNSTRVHANIIALCSLVKYEFHKNR